MPKVVSSVEKMAEDIGFDIANSDNITQAKLFNGFSKGWRLLMNNNEIDMQICYMVNELEPEAKNILVKIAEFCKDDV